MAANEREPQVACHGQEQNPNFQPDPKFQITAERTDAKALMQVRATVTVTQDLDPLINSGPLRSG